MAGDLSFQTLLDQHDKADLEQTPRSNSRYFFAGHLLLLTLKGI